MPQKDCRPVLHEIIDLNPDDPDYTNPNAAEYQVGVAGSIAEVMLVLLMTILSEKVKRYFESCDSVSRRTRRYVCFLIFLSISFAPGTLMSRSKLLPYQMVSSQEIASFLSAASHSCSLLHDSVASFFRFMGSTRSCQEILMHMKICLWVSLNTICGQLKTLRKAIAVRVCVYYYRTYYF
eukprot:284819298_3